MNTRSLKNGIVLVLATALNAACTSGTASSMVNKLQVTTTRVKGETMLNATADLTTGSVTMVPTAITILNPKNADQKLGQISVLAGLGESASQLQVSIDVNQALKLSGDVGPGVLPNGTTIPIAGIEASNWITIPIGQLNSFVYLNVDSTNKKAVVGVAFDVEAIASGVAGDVLIPFTYNAISSMAGVYTGFEKGTSGIATFIDFSAQMSSIGGFGSVNFEEHYTNPDAIEAHMIEIQKSGHRIHLR